MAVQAVPAYLQNASHSAALFRQAMSNPYATAGVLSAGEMAVGAQGTPNMSVLVGAGRAKVAGSQISPPTLLSGATAGFTTQAMYDVLNDASVTLTIATADPTNPRIDTVYVAVQDSYYSGSNNQAVLGVVTGTPAPSPVASAAPSNALVLGYVAVAANATSIVAGNITQAATLAQAFNAAYTYGAFTPTGLYSAGTPTPRAGLLGSRIFGEGTIVSSSASFATGTSYTLGSFPAAFAGSNTQVMIAISNSAPPVALILAPSGSLSMQVSAAYTGTLAVHLDGVSWKPAGY